MTARPIIFGAPMVRAILTGQKSQTRRVVKLPKWMAAMHGNLDAPSTFRDPGFGDGQYLHVTLDDEIVERVTCPYGWRGDRLWVRETWGTIVWSVIYGDRRAPRTEIVYRAGPHPFDKDVPHGWPDGGRWRPSIHMPRSASRLTLDVTNVRVERLQDISEDDARAEGLGLTGLIQPGHAAGCYSRLWDEINAKRAPWASNPWVWVIEFQRVAS